MRDQIKLKLSIEEIEESKARGLCSIIEHRSSSLLAARRQRKSDIRRVSAPSTLDHATGSCKRIDTSSATRETTNRRWSVVAGGIRCLWLCVSQRKQDHRMLLGCKRADTSESGNRGRRKRDYFPLIDPRTTVRDRLIPGNYLCMMNYSLLGTYEKDLRKVRRIHKSRRRFETLEFLEFHR